MLFKLFRILILKSLYVNFYIRDLVCQKHYSKKRDIIFLYIKKIISLLYFLTSLHV